MRRSLPQMAYIKTIQSQQIIRSIQVLRNPENMLLPAIVNPGQWQQGNLRNLSALLLSGRSPVQWDQEGNPAHRAVPVNAEKSVPRESQALRGRRGPPDQWGPEENLARAGLRDLPAIRKTVYLHRSQARI